MDQSEKLNVLDDVLRIKTVNGNEKAVADYLKELFEKHGIESEYDKVDENRFNLIASITKGNGKILGFTGHEDVVATVNDSEWNNDPFEPAHIDGKIFCPRSH